MLRFIMFIGTLVAATGAANAQQVRDRLDGFNGVRFGTSFEQAKQTLGSAAKADTKIASGGRKLNTLSIDASLDGQAYRATYSEMKVKQMANGKDLRRIALSLHGATEAPHFDRAAFKVECIYATLAADGRTVNLRLLPEEQEFKCMLAPEAFAPVRGAWGKQRWTTATLSALSATELSDVLETEWRHAMTKTRARR
jgi:hypothetical protein